VYISSVYYVWNTLPVGLYALRSELYSSMLEERRNKSDLIEVFKMFYGYTQIDIRVLFTLHGNDKGLRGHSTKICKSRFNTDIRKYFFLKSSH